MSITLGERLAALREALEAAEGRFADRELREAQTLLARAGVRRTLGDETVVALAGGTGSGKSSLFNALARNEVSPTGVRRPTTDTTHALIWDEGGAETGELLDWLGVSRRHYVARPDGELRGLVLLDLPDHDSTEQAHRREVDRLVQLVDLFVWVVDPQKYADAALHERYLRPYASHGAAMLVVLNKVDLLEESERDSCLADLRRLLAGEGLADVAVFAASTRTEVGIDGVRGALAQRVAERRAWAIRIAADIRLVARRLAVHCPGPGGAGMREISVSERAPLVDALAVAAGVPVVTEAVERSVRARGTAATTWPLLRWLNWRSDPLRRLHIGMSPGGDRTGVPPAGPFQAATASAALRRLRHAIGDELPAAWREDLRRSLEESERLLPDELDRAVAGTDPGAEGSSRWWGPVGAVQWLLMMGTLLGAAWLLGLAVLGYLQIADLVPTPRLGGLPLPTLLLLGGLLASLLLMVARRPLVALEARRRAGRAEARMRSRIEVVVEQQVVEQIKQVRLASERFCEALARAGRSP